MGEKKERRYAVDFEHFENAMLTEANLGWQVYMAQRWKMAPERRRKLTLMLKRFVGELQSEIDQQKAKVRELEEMRNGALARVDATRPAYPNGD